MSQRDAVVATLRGCLPGLQQRFGVRKFRLYGSMARGQERDDSDIDVIIEFDKVPTLFELGRIQEELERLLGRRVDVKTSGGLHPLVREQAQKEGLDIETQPA